MIRHTPAFEALRRARYTVPPTLPESIFAACLLAAAVFFIAVGLIG